MATTNLNITPYRVAIVAAFQAGKTGPQLAREEALSISSIYALTGDLRFVCAARKAPVDLTRAHVRSRVEA